MDAPHCRQNLPGLLVLPKVARLAQQLHDVEDNLHDAWELLLQSAALAPAIRLTQSQSLLEQFSAAAAAACGSRTPQPQTQSQSSSCSRSRSRSRSLSPCENCEVLREDLDVMCEAGEKLQDERQRNLQLQDEIKDLHTEITDRKIEIDAQKGELIAKNSEIEWLEEQLEEWQAEVTRRGVQCSSNSSNRQQRLQ